MIYVKLKVWHLGVDVETSEFPPGREGEEGARISPNILDFLGALSDMHKKREGATGSAAQYQSTLDSNRRAPCVVERTRETSGRLRIAI